MITKVYKAQFKESLIPLGFRLSKNTFFKVVNDVIQTIMLTKDRYDCSIGFDIMPLSLGISHLDVDGNNISQFREGLLKGWDWKFEPMELYYEKGHIVFNDGSVEDIVKNMLSIVESKVLPIFERAINCKSALAEQEKHEIEVFGKIMFTEVNQYTYLTYLKLGEYEKASAFLARRIAQSEESIAHNVRNREEGGIFFGMGESAEEYRDVAQKRLQGKKDELVKLAIPDVKYFQKIIADGEKTTLEFLGSLGRKRK